MAHSVECRLPFMDYRLVSLVFKCADGWKLHGPWNKYLLRESMRRRIPEPVRPGSTSGAFRCRKASGFPAHGTAASRTAGESRDARKGYL